MQPGCARHAVRLGMTAERPSGTGAGAAAATRRVQAHEQMRRGEYAAAVQTLRALQCEQPEDAGVLAELGEALRASGDVQAAIDVCQTATRLAPRIATVWLGLGRALVAAVRLDQARPAFERALACDPRLALARIELGDLLRNLGDAAAAAVCYRACLSDAEHAPRAWFQLANLKVEPLTAADMTALRERFARAGQSDGARVFSGFALARAQEDQGLHRAAFTTLLEANRIARRHVRWDAPAFARTIAAIDAAFT